MTTPAPQLRTVTDTITEVSTSQLFAAQFDPSRAVPGRRNLRVAGVAVASLGPDSKINPVSATSAEGMPVVEMLAALAAGDPTGVLAIESPDGLHAFAFAIDQGRVTGARGPGHMGQLERWCAEVHSRFPERFGRASEDSQAGSPTWLKIARTFVTERVLEHLKIALEPGCRMTFLRGDVEWLGTVLPGKHSVGLTHLLLEHARRRDELPKLFKRLGSLEQVAIPMSEPDERSGPIQVSPGEPAEDAWDFFDEPDPAAQSEWEDARTVWMLCDGRHTLREISERAMLGSFRGYNALQSLARSQFILIANTAPGLDARHAVETPPQGLAGIVSGEMSGEMSGLAADIAPVLQLHALPPEPEPQIVTEYAVIRRQTRTRPPSESVVFPGASQPQAHVRSPWEAHSPAEAENTQPDLFSQTQETKSVVAMPVPVSAKAPRPPPSRARRAVTFVALGSLLFAAGAAAAFAIARIEAPPVGAEP